ncbi:uncharacterized protein LOC128716184 [Anopheles marshallii]|uniref:uncharacterized protein LOC128716184 n=1 Tax=Anopheles marshallii TaxID=1521116 RepID=UPI00237B1170|nr:uncharacterized protein LOC128716184 [Anopheles marshallii]
MLQILPLFFKMPPTVADIFTVDSNNSSNPISRRTRRRSSVSISDNLAPGVTSRRSQRTQLGKKDENKCIILPDVQRRLMGCRVLLTDIFSPGSQLQYPTKHIKDVSNVNHNVPEKDVTVKQSFSGQSNLQSTERNSYVTRRTNSRLTRSIRRHESLAEKRSGTVNIAADDSHSIIHLDESSIGMTNVTELADVIQTFSSNDVIVQTSKDVTDSQPRRLTRGMALEDLDSNENTIASRTSSNRKSDHVITEKDTGVSPPKRSPSVFAPSILRRSAATASSKATTGSEAAAKQSINTGTSSSNRSLSKLNNDAFKILIVSIKRIASALSEAELKRLKYEDSTQNSRVSLRSSSEIGWRPKSRIKVENKLLARTRSTMTKPKIMISSPIIEVPESPPVPERNRLAHSYLAVPKTTHTAQLDRFKKPHPTTQPSLPLLIEHEDEENDDVYEFLSSSQNSEIAKSNETTQKAARHKTVQKTSVKNKRKATAAKPKPKPPKQQNPFGCNKKTLKKIIKQLGGGPVKQPDTVDYKINMEIPKTPPVVASPVPEPQQLDDTELPYHDYNASVKVSRIGNPTVDRLKAAQPPLALTSTPFNKVNNLNVTAAQKPASPWRLQDEITVPRTSYTHRTKEMLPSYESFAIENNNIPVRTSAFVTERRKSPNEGTESIVPPVPEKVAESSIHEEQSFEGIVSDKDLREFEQMYLELKATSEMSQKLITAIHHSKKNRTTPKQNQAMRLACLKLKKWYDRSMNTFNRSMRIINNLQRTTEQSDNRAVACPSPLSLEQQRAVHNFNLSTDHFRSMIDQLHSAINDSDVENRPPALSSFEAADTGLQGNGNGPITKLHKVTTSQPPKDVIILPERGTNAKRNPLMPLNVVPLPQRTSPLISPLAKNPTTGPNTIRRELQYDKENESIQINDKQQQKDIENVPQRPTPDLSEPYVGSVVEINDETAHNDCAYNDDNTCHNSNDGSTEAIEGTRNFFGFDDAGDSVEETSTAQVTLPMPLNISHETLQRRLRNMKQLLPKRPFFRTQPKHQNRSSGPTRFPTTKLRAFGSPTKRPHTLREFIASTPRPAETGSSTVQATVAPKSLQPFDVETPDVSAIELITEPAAAVEQNDHGAQNNEPDVALFDTPDRQEWLNKSAHQRTYTRIPRRKKINIYLANLGLDDDSEEDEENAPPQELSSDSETDVAKRKKKPIKRKAQRKVEQTKEFKQFVDDFNGMCAEVDRYEMIIE